MLVAICSSLFALRSLLLLLVAPSLLKQGVAISWERRTTMKTNPVTARRTLLLLVSALLLCLSISSISLAFDYQALEIAPLAGYASSRALGINNAGQVVGRFYNIDSGTGEAINRKAFIWDRTGGARLLSTLSGECSAWGINNNGYASGYSYTSQGNQHAVIWNSTTNAITDIGTLRNTVTSVYGPTSTAYNLNDLNQVVGNADIPNDAGDFTPFHAIKYSVTTGIVDLGTFTTSSPEWQNGYSIAYDINGNGDTVGIAHDSSWAFLPFIHNNSTGMQQLAIDTNYQSGEWYAVAINDSGLIGGHVIAATNQSLPYYWPNKSSNPVKITMPAGFPYGEIYGINASGQMVGIMWSSDQAGATEHAFIFDTTHGVRDLNALFDASSGWVLNFARDINDKGQVVGYGEKSGLKRGFVLDPSSSAAGDELGADFATNGLWDYNTANSTWTKLTDWNAAQEVKWGSNRLAAKFTAYGTGNGIYSYAGTSWTKITDWIPDDMISWGSNQLAAKFSNYGAGNGIWSYNGTSWAKLTDLVPATMVSWGTNLAGAFTSYGSSNGIWNYNGTSWTKLTDWLPDDMVSVGSSQLVAKFSNYGAGNGLYAHNGTSWTKLTDWVPSDMASWGSNQLAAVFSSYGASNGVWNYNGTSWSRLTDWVPADILSWGSNALAAKFNNYGASNGIWNYNGAAWSKLTDWIPAGFVSVGTDSVMAAFSSYGTGNGVWRYNGTWTRATDWVPEAMADVNVF
jgi:hypothetical protein